MKNKRRTIGPMSVSRSGKYGVRVAGVSMRAKTFLAVRRLAEKMAVEKPGLEIKICSGSYPVRIERGDYVVGIGLESISKSKLKTKSWKTI